MQVIACWRGQGQLTSFTQLETVIGHQCALGRKGLFTMRLLAQRKLEGTFYVRSAERKGIEPFSMIASCDAVYRIDSVWWLGGFSGC